MFVKTKCAIRVGLLTLSSALAFTAMPSHAAKVGEFNVGGWVGGAHIDDKTGRFSHCVVQGEFESGNRLLFSTTNDGGWSFGIANSKWNLTDGATHDIHYRIDGKGYISARASARGRTLAQVILPKDAVLLRSFKNAHGIDIKTGYDELKFQLPHAKEMLSKLFDCSRYHIEAFSPNADTRTTGHLRSRARATARQGAAVASPTVATRREARTAVSYLMKKVGMNYKFQNASSQGSLYRKNDVVWKMKRMVGTLRILPNTNFSAGDIIADVRSGDSRVCNGRFAKEAASTDTGQAIDFIVACDDVANATNVKGLSAYYAILPRREGGHYMLSLVGYMTDHNLVRATGIMLKDTAVALNARGSVPGARSASFQVK